MAWYNAATNPSYRAYTVGRQPANRRKPFARPPAGPSSSPVTTGGSAGATAATSITFYLTGVQCALFIDDDDVFLLPLLLLLNLNLSQPDNCMVVAVLILSLADGVRGDADFGALLKGDRSEESGGGAAGEECEVDNVKNNEAIKMLSTLRDWLQLC